MIYTNKSNNYNMCIIMDIFADTNQKFSFGYEKNVYDIASELGYENKDNIGALTQYWHNLGLNLDNILKVDFK